MLFAAFTSSAAEVVYYNIPAVAIKQQNVINTGVSIFKMLSPGSWYPANDSATTRAQTGVVLCTLQESTYEERTGTERTSTMYAKAVRRSRLVPVERQNKSEPRVRFYSNLYLRHYIHEYGSQFVIQQSVQQQW